MQNRRNVFRALTLAGVMGVLPASAQQATPPATAPAAAPAAADSKAIVVGSVVQLRSGGPKMTVVELLAANTAAVQWHQENAGFKKETFPVAALKAVDADDEDDEEDEEEDE